MSDSVLLKLTRDSILEVYQAKRIIDKKSILTLYPVLNETINVIVEIFLDDELRGYYKSDNELILLENIIIGAKKAAFESTKFPPLTSSEYLHVKIKLTLLTKEGNMSEVSMPLFDKEAQILF
jgi:AMMECR1 domain-containing protein